MSRLIGLIGSCLVGIYLSENSDIITSMKLAKIFKALSNEARLQILEWLKEPRRHFAEGIYMTEGKGLNIDEVGVCVGLIQQKAGLSQSTISEYLALLQEAGLVQARRIGQWTYYKRNEKAIKD